MMQRMLKTAEPTMVPTPTSPLVMNTPGAAEKYAHVQTHTHTIVTPQRGCMIVLLSIYSAATIFQGVSVRTEAAERQRDGCGEYL